MIIIVVLALLIPTAICQGGGMAELKSITGDEPYRGLGENPPQPIPQPMGFWGRPRYAPVGYYGSGGLYGGSPFGYGGLSRFTSVGHSPYEALGPIAAGDLGGWDLDDFSQPSSPYRSSVVRPSYSPYQPSSFSPSNIGGPFGGARSGNTFSPSSSSSPFSSPSSVSGGGGRSTLAELTGGFYKGRGNEMMGR